VAIDPGLRRLALRVVLAAFAGQSTPEWALALVNEGLAGHALFGPNIGSPDQLARLTATIRSARADVLIATDEEGGDVTRLNHRTGSPYPGNAALGAIDDPELTHAMYAAIGADLARAGINLDLAPVVDVNTAAANPIIGTRAFGADPVLVARHSAAAVTGLQEAGVAACAKHFPGHGATVTDSHLELPTVDEPDLPPFAAAIAAGTQAIMTAHIRVPALTGGGPATFSRAVLTDLLRGELGFAGVVITDALEMKGAARAAGGVGAAAVLALAAGADLLCLGSRVDLALVEAVIASIVEAVRDGRLPVARLAEAGERTAGMASWARRPFARGAHDEAVGYEAPGYAAARRAIRVDGEVGELTRPLVVQVESGSSIAEGGVPWGLRPHLGDVEQVSVAATSGSAPALVSRAAGRPMVLVGRRVHRPRGGRELIAALAAQGDVIVVEMGWPSPWRPAGARAFLTTYGSSHANGRAAAEALGLLPSS
jgi:beta-N-acetylhexosaminidase